MAENKFPVSIVINAVDNVTIKAMEINEKLKKISEPITKLNQSFSLLGKETGLSKVADAAANVGKKGSAFFKELGASAVKLGAVVGVAAAGFKYFVLGATDALDTISDVSERVGVSTRMFQGLQYSARQSGLDIEQLEPALTKFSKTLGESSLGIGENVKLFDALGVSQSDLKNLSFDQVLEKTSAGLQKIKDKNVQNKVAMELFGKQGVKLIDTLNNIGAKTDEADKLGLIFNDDAIKAAAKFDDTFKLLGDTFNVLRNTIGVELIPIFQTMAEELTLFFRENKPAIQDFGKALAVEIPKIIQGLKSGFSILMTAVAPIIFAFKTLGAIFGTTNLVAAALSIFIGGKLLLSFISLGASIGGFVTALIPALLTGLGFLKVAFMALGTIIAANPIGAIVVGVVALISLGVLLYKKWEPFRDLIDGIWSKIKDVGSVIGSFLGFGDSSANSGASKGPALGAPSGGAAFAQQQLQSFKSSSSNELKVSFDNAPKGTRVDAEKAPDVIDTSLGFSMSSP